MTKAGVKPKGVRALTAVEKTQRQRMKNKLIAQGMAEQGYKPITAYIDESHIEALDVIAKSYGAGEGLNERSLIAMNEFIFLALRDFINNHPEETKHLKVSQMSFHEAVHTHAIVEFNDWSKKNLEELK